MHASTCLNMHTKCFICLAKENSGSWLLPLRTGNWELDQIVRDEEYRNAVKYLQEAVHSTPPVPAALLPLVQVKGT